MEPGDMVFWRKEHRGGYGYSTRFPAMVVRVNPKTVRIRLGMLNISARVTETVERNVKPESLTVRHRDCGFDGLLSSNAKVSGAGNEARHD